MSEVIISIEGYITILLLLAVSYNIDKSSSNLKNGLKQITEIQY